MYGEKTLHDDMLVRALEIPRLSRFEYQRSAPRMKPMAEALAEGRNYYLVRHRRK